VIRRLLAGAFEGALTIDPHLHTLGKVMHGIPAIAIDDHISSGPRLIAAAPALHAAGATRVDALPVHGFATTADHCVIQAAGIASIRVTNSVAGPLTQLPVAPALAQAIIEQGWTGAPRT
jgi:ribose-phosphate pyrophosphokinase